MKKNFTNDLRQYRTKALDALCAVLSKKFVGFDEEIQILTYDQLKELVFIVIQNR